MRVVDASGGGSSACRRKELGVYAIAGAAAGGGSTRSYGADCQEVLKVAGGGGLGCFGDRDVLPGVDAAGKSVGTIVGPVLQHAAQNLLLSIVELVLEALKEALLVEGEGDDVLGAGLGVERHAQEIPNPVGNLKAALRTIQGTIIRGSIGLDGAGQAKQYRPPDAL